MTISQELKTENSYIGQGLKEGDKEGQAIIVTATYEDGEAVEMESISIQSRTGEETDVTALFDDWGLVDKIMESIDWTDIIIDYQVSMAEHDAEMRIGR